jgi:hypothetical protein
MKSDDYEAKLMALLIRSRKACDVCSSITTEALEGYLLTTTEVVASEGYWNRHFRMIMRMHNIPLMTLRKDLVVIVARIARSDTPWIICEACSRLFSFDRIQGKKNALNWRLTGQPAGGFALCRIYEGSEATTVVNIDDDGMIVAMKAAVRAILVIEGESPDRSIV